MDTQQQNIAIVIPAYNEATVIGDVISGLRRGGYTTVIVVDDGSRDATAERARAAGADVLPHIINRGQGAALASGIAYARIAYNPDVIVTFDADGQHHAEDIAALVAPILNDSADIVLGSRFLGADHCHAPALRRAILRAAVVFTNILSNVRLTDTHNGLRALGRRAATCIHITRRGMEHASDIIDQIAPCGLRYREVPVTITYSDYSLAKGQRTSGFIKLGCKILLHKLLR